MNDSYSFGKIIFGLRKEYLEIGKQLDLLKQYVDVSKRIESFDFRIVGNPCKILLCLNKKKNILERLELLLNLYIHGRTHYNVTDGVSNSYFYNKRELCFIEKKDELNKKIEEIIQTDFFRHIVANNYTSIPCIENNVKSLLITAGRIKLFNGFHEVFPYLEYFPYSDEIFMKNEEKVITPDDLFKLLNLSLDGKYLNDYHHKVLDIYEEKEIDIEDSFDSNSDVIEIKEEPKKLILKPKKSI